MFVELVQKYCQTETLLACVAYFQYKEGDTGQQEYAWSVRFLSLCKLISSLIGSPWFCGATTQSKEDQATTNAHYNAFAELHFFASVLVTSYTHMATGFKCCSATYGTET